MDHLSGDAAHPDPVAAIVALLRSNTALDFSRYKIGTLRRRIERRMAMAGLEPDAMATYLAVLRQDAAELARLGDDLLINVTNFFRDPDVFAVLAHTIVPDLVREREGGQFLRIWVVGCSTGEETYSLAMLFAEEIERVKSSVRLQLFATDVDPDAVASARHALYPATIAAEVTAERLTRFFVKDGQNYRVRPELRAYIAFAVHDVLADPPFSRMDLVSCRNLLIYLRTDAQTRVIGLLHFALRDRGILLLGQAETIGNAAGRFEFVSKADRIFRRVGRSRPAEFAFLAADDSRLPTKLALGPPPTRQAGLADLCRKLVMENFAPAAVLINRRYECLYSLGPTDRYLRVVPGHPTHDLLAMVRPGLRLRLRTAIERAYAGNSRVVLVAAGGFGIAVQPVSHDGDQLLLICFVEELQVDPAVHRDQMSSVAQPQPEPYDGAPQQGVATPDDPRIALLERELDATKSDLREAITNLERLSEEQSAIHEEALSVNEEYQSTNEELLTSKEELQSLNEELTALNSQLQETLDRQRVTASDMQNILYSTDTATLFLDKNLNIRFFTPATRAIFHVISSDVGRPLADLTSLAVDPDLLTDAQVTLDTLATTAREIAGPGESWFLRRVLPYRTHDDTLAGVVITFADITERKLAARALEVAKHNADKANLAKSRFLAAASHDLRQPLQTLVLLQGLLARKVEGEAVQKLVALLDPTLNAMSGMLNTLLDISQIDAGTVRAEVVAAPVGDLLCRLGAEFHYHAQAQGLQFHVVPCTRPVMTDPRLLEQMVRNLLSNAFKYTSQGKVLLGCRRHGQKLTIEVWDSGIGIAEDQLEAIFAEYHQIGNAAQERSRGLGLGLPIVRRLADLLGHRVWVRSRPGKGSVFAIELDQPAEHVVLTTSRPTGSPAPQGEISGRRAGTILVIEDDPEVSRLLELLLDDEGHRVLLAADGVAALRLVTQGGAQPDVILADYNLPAGMTGLQAVGELRHQLGRQVPVIMLSGDIATATLRDIAGQDCWQLSKPVKPADLVRFIQKLLPGSAASDATQNGADAVPVIFVVDDDANIRRRLRNVLEANGWMVVDYASCEDFLAAYRPGRAGCLLLDAVLPGMSGIKLLQLLKNQGQRLPVVLMTGRSDVKTAVAAMQAGAVDFIEKPFRTASLLASLTQALEQSRDAGKLAAWQRDAADQLAGLTNRQVQIMDLVLAGQPSKNIAADLAISQRTVENHRAAIMRKTGVSSLPALARLAIAARAIS